MPAQIRRSTRPGRRARAVAHAMEALEPRQLLTRLVGIDVSEHQGSINWTSVKNTAGKNFAFIRATYGKTSDDLTFLDNVNATTGAIAKGLYAGFYHYAYYDLDSTHTATAEADNFFDRVKPYLNAGGKVMNPVLDVEEPLRTGWVAADLVQWVKDWGARVKSRATSELGLTLVPIVYMGASNAGNGSYITSELAQTFPLWVAQWPSTLPDPQTGEASSTGFWQDWQVWQYSSTGSVSGISGNVDLDVMNGDADTVQDYIIGSAGKWADGTWLQVNAASGLKAWDASTCNPNAPYNDTFTTAPNGTIGKVLQGPVYGNGYERWQIQYNNGMTGWSAEPFLNLLSPGAVSNPNPANNASVTTLPANFTWNAGANASFYKVYLDGSLQTTVSTNSWTHGTIAGGSHTWRIDSINGSLTATGTTWNFNYNNAPAVPSNPNPANNAIVNVKPLTLDWADSLNATSYDIYLGSSTSPTANVTVSQYGPITPADGLRLWRVVAKNGGVSTSGPQWQYTMDSTPPDATLGTQTPGTGAATFDFVVTYSDATTSVDATTFGDNDVLVTGPNAFSQNATLVSSSGNAVTYRIIAPGGTWDFNDNGTYTVSQNANQVKDAAGNYRAAGTIGTLGFTAAFAYMTGSTLNVQFDGTLVPIQLATTGSDITATRNATTLSFTGVSDINVIGTNADDRLQISAPVAPPMVFNNGSGNDLIEVVGGTYSFSGDAGGPNRNVGILVTSGAAVVFDATQHLRSLSIDGLATLSADGDKVLVTDALAITGKLNLTNNDMVVNYTGDSVLGTWNGSAYTGVAGLLASGSNGGTWDGNGIVTDRSDAISPSVLTTLAVAEASDALGLGPTDTGLFGSETVDGTSVLVKYTWGGDANLDGTLNGDDYFQIDSHFNQDGVAFHFYNGDFNLDGSINGDDYFIIDSNWNAGSTGPVL